MFMTSTNLVDGYKVKEYKGIVCGEVIEGLDFIRDIGAGFANIFGGRSASYEEPLQNARTTALQEMQERAEKLGANAVIGIDIDYEVLGSNNGMLMVATSGTAVVLEKE